MSAAYWLTWKMWRILLPTAPRRNHYQNHKTLSPMRLVYLYPLFIILFYVYIRYHGYLFWFKSDGHVTPKAPVFHEKKNDLFAYFKPVAEPIETRIALKQEKETDFNTEILPSYMFKQKETTMLNHEGTSKHSEMSGLKTSSDSLTASNNQDTITNKHDLLRVLSRTSKHSAEMSVLKTSASLTASDNQNNITNKHDLLRVLRSQWKRYVKMDVDWRIILDPCKTDMAWIINRTTHLQTSIVTSSVTTNIQPAREFSSIYIHTRTINGIDKTIGGDAWRVYIRGETALVAKVIDHNNGSYEALFFVQEPGYYSVNIVLDFSQCDGLRDPPSDWFIQGRYHVIF